MVINPKRMVRVLGRAFFVVAPLLLVVLILSAGTELYVRGIPLADFRRLRELWPVIVRDMIPGLVAMFIAYWLAARFVQSLYGLEKLSQGFGFLWRWRFGQMKFTPYLLIREGRIARDKEKVLTRVGGPGNLVIYHDSAVVLEHAGRLTRLEQSDFVPLGPFEKVYKAIDLRPKRKMQSVEAMSREGIPVTCELDIRYRIRPGDKEPTEKLPFPVSARDALKAVTCAWKCEPHISEDGELDWEKLVTFAHTMGLLRSIVARYPLDQLVSPAGWEEDELHPRQAIKQELERELRSAAREQGAEILSVDLGHILVQDEVTEQWIAAWKAEWERQMMERRAEGEAEYVARVETAKAQAQAEMILSLTQALQSLAADPSTLNARLDLLRTIAMLRQVSRDPRTQASLPAGTMRALTTLQGLIAGTEGQQG